MRDLAVAIQDRIQAPESDLERLCGRLVEFRDLMKSLKEMGAATSDDVTELERAEKAALECRSEG